MDGNIIFLAMCKEASVNSARYYSHVKWWYFVVIIFLNVLNFKKKTQKGEIVLSVKKFM
jgi:hypothetical protein